MKKEVEREVSGAAVAWELDVDPATVRRWRRQGCPSETYNAKMIRYRLSAVRDWLRQKRRAGDNEA